MLSVRGIDVFYGDMQAVWDVSFDVGQGKIVAIIGANGAGKSTILRTISGLLRPQKGEIEFMGRRLDKEAPYKLIEYGIAHVPEARRLFVEMTVEENMEMGSLRGDAKKERGRTKERMFELFPRLRERMRQLAGTLSGGEQQMLAMARGLMSKPKLIMLDEPSLGLAPILVKEIFNIATNIRDEGMTVLIVEQNTKQTLTIADHAYVLESGRIALSGKGKDLINNDHVRTAYLGVS